MSDITIHGILFEAHICPSCGVLYTVPKDVIESHRNHGGNHYCSNGHSLGWGSGGASNSEWAKMRRRAERAEQEKARLSDEADRLQTELQKAGRRERRLKKRASAGTCPCCNRTFSNMARHMKHQHPEFAADNVVKLPKGKTA